MAAADTMLVVIGPGWLNAKTAAGARRLDDPGDFVRTEIVAALKAGVLVLPILVQGASMPVAHDLPADIRDLAVRHAIALSTSSWKEDVEAIASQVEGAAGVRSNPHAMRLPALLRSRDRRLVLVAAALVVLAALGGAASWIVEWIRPDDRRRIERFAQDLLYELPLDVVTTAMSQIQATAARAGAPAVTDLAVERLKRLVVVSNDTTDKGREIRRRAIEAIKVLRRNDLSRDFDGEALRAVDLVDADLGRTSLKGVSLERGFLIRTDFSAADLTGANLSATWVRNSDFGAATMTGANVDEMDWFNAQGFAADQLGSVDRSTLAACPRDDAGRTSESTFRKLLNEDYGFQWEQMGSDRDQMARWWSIYAAPGGLCDQVDRWRMGS